MSDKILLLHGALDSTGLNFFTKTQHETPEETGTAPAKYDCRENVRVLSRLFSAIGFKIIYSGWEDDTVWLNTNSELFDAIHVGTISELGNSQEPQDRLHPTDNERRYFSIYAGCLAAKQISSLDSTVVCLRSDVFLDHRSIDRNLTILNQVPNAFLIEYADLNKTYFVPEFVTAGSLGCHIELYDSLLNTCRESGRSGSPSDTDHGTHLSRLIDQGTISHVVCMDESIHRMMVWRGIPRYAAAGDNPPSRTLVFNCVLNYPGSVPAGGLVEPPSAEKTSSGGETPRILH